MAVVETVPQPTKLPQPETPAPEEKKPFASNADENKARFRKPCRKLDQMSLIRGRRYNRAKKGVGEHTGNQYSEIAQNDPIPNTAETLAKEHGLWNHSI